MAERLCGKPLIRHSEHLDTSWKEEYASFAQRIGSLVDKDNFTEQTRNPRKSYKLFNLDFHEHVKPCAEDLTFYDICISCQVWKREKIQLPENGL